MTTRIDCRDISGDAVIAEHARVAYDDIVKDGYAVLDNIVPAARVAALHEEFNSRYDRYLRDVEHDDSQQVGDRRYRVPIEFSGGFADPLIYAHPVVLALVRQTLGADAIIESYGAVVSLAGAEQQHTHRDGPLLFEAAISPLLPCHALTFAMPLIGMDADTGTTGLWPGSHRWKAMPEGPAPEMPAIPAGSCVLWDFRLIHSGTANNTGRHRPMIYATYARSWYRDPTAYTRAAQVRLAFGNGFLEELSDDRRILFNHLYG
jgi:ectoine hydroxylase-related dioxygenase (phytanoyl-CoA dioxygenase family)